MINAWTLSGKMLMGAGRSHRWLWVVAFFVAAQLVLIPPLRAAPDPSNDPRFLSALTEPYGGVCAQDVSDDGHLLFVACAAPPEKESEPELTKLFVYDISDLRSLHQISETALGAIGATSLVVRKTTAFIMGWTRISGGGADPGRSLPILLVDVRDPVHPRAAGQVEAAGSQYFRVSDDGHVLALRSVKNRFRFFDTSNPDKPVEIFADRDGLSDLDRNPGKWGSFFTGHLPGIVGPVNILDVRGGMALILTPETLQLYKLNEPNPATLAASLAPDPETYVVNIIPGRDALVFGNRTHGKWEIVFLTAASLGFDGRRLLQVYDDTAKFYARCGDRSVEGDCWERNNVIARLVDAGIERLIDQGADGISAGQRVAMLNDYGFWLYQWRAYDAHALDTSVRVLRKVVGMASRRATAWLDLGDSVHALIPLAGAQDQKVRLWREAESSYARYRALSGKEAPGDAELKGLDIPKLVGQTKDVCDYVAEAYNHGRQDLITSPKGSVTVKGATTTFVVGLTGGSCSWPKIKTEGCDREFCDDGKKLSRFRFPDEGFGAASDSIAIVPFRGKYYTLDVQDHAPARVIDPIAGPVCRFERQEKPVLVENNDPELCGKYFEGRVSHNVAWSPLPDSWIGGADIDLAIVDAQFDRVSTVGIDGQQKRIGHFTIASEAGCGCDESGVAFVDDHEVMPGEPNKSLIEEQRKWWRCGGADADLTLIAGQTYIDAWAGSGVDQHVVPRVLLQISGQAVKSMCRVDRAIIIRPMQLPKPGKK